MKHPIEGIRNAFARAHAIITGQLVNGQRAHYMSVPPDHERDVDLIITGAIDELAELRSAVATLTAERDAALARLAAAGALVDALQPEYELSMRAGTAVLFGQSVRKAWPEMRAALAPRSEGESAQDPTRCEICGWTLAESRDKGCVAGDCSYRPSEGSDEWYRIKANRDRVAARAKKEGR